MSGGAGLDQLSTRWQVLTASGRNEEALELVRAQLDAHREEPYVWTLLSQTLNNLGEGADGESAARQALDLEPRSVWALNNLSRSLALQGRIPEGEAVAEQAVALDDQQAGSHAWLALLRNERGNYGKALEGVRQALRLEPSSDHFALLAEIHVNMGQPEQARAALADGLAEDPQNRRLLLLSGRISNGALVVGDQAALLTGMLAASPLDSGALDRLRQEVLARLRNLTLLPWLQGVVFCFLAPLIADIPAGGAAPLAVYAALAVILRAVVLLRRLSRTVPSGFLRDVLRESPDARRGAAALIAAEGWVLSATLGAGVAAAGDPLRWFLILLLGGAALALVSRYLFHRAAYRALEGFTEDTAPVYAAARDRYAGDRSGPTTVIVVLGALLGLLALLQQAYTVFAGAASVCAGAFILVQGLHFVAVKCSLRRYLNRRPSPEGQSDRPGRLGKPPVSVLLLGVFFVVLPVLMLAVGIRMLAGGSVPAG